MPVSPRVFNVLLLCIGNAAPSTVAEPILNSVGRRSSRRTAGMGEQKRRALSEAARILRNRIRIFTNLSLEKLDRPALQKKLGEIGSTNGPVE